MNKRGVSVNVIRAQAIKRNRAARLLLRNGGRDFEWLWAQLVLLRLTSYTAKESFRGNLSKCGFNSVGGIITVKKNWKPTKRVQPKPKLFYQHDLSLLEKIHYKASKAMSYMEGTMYE